ncbi:MAG: leucine-rich repeat domain-containing protein [Clostridia bacterium]|nr:leucine-rich repeat domain-containing protein [Clostridia bacterium]
MKRFLAILFCTCLFFSLSLFGIVTVNAASTEGNYTYSVVNGEAIIKKYDKYNGVRGELVIPSHLGGYPVTEIDSSAFYNNTYLTSVVLPDSVKKIGDLAFAECHKLDAVSIPPSLKKLSGSAFNRCDISKVYITDVAAWCNIEYIGNVFGVGPFGSTRKLYLNNSLITKLIIPEGVTHTSFYAFFGCDSITCVVLPKSILSVANGSFSNCTNIKDVWYAGSESDKSSISINSGNTYLINATWHYDSCPVGAPHSYNNDCDTSCNGCGKIRTVSGHSYDNACDTTCNICNETRTVSHTYDNTCDTQCNVCKSNRTISHTYGEWEVTKQATCTESGAKARKCRVCSNTETATISSLGHNFSTEWTVDKKATCTTAGSKSNHCARCSATSNNTTILTSGHSWGNWITEKKATDKTEGLSVRKCSECGLKETQSIAKLAADGHTHKFSEWKVIKAATCKEKGNATRICSICKEQEQKDLLATGHQVGEWIEVSATCTNDGACERTCVVCNETEKITIKALGHEFEKPIVIKEPTNNENGIKQGKCKRCGEETTEEIPALLSDNDNTSSTSSNAETKSEIEVNRDTNKNTGNNWFIWTLIGIIVLIGIGIGVYLIMKKRAH